MPKNNNIKPTSVPSGISSARTCNIRTFLPSLLTKDKIPDESRKSSTASTPVMHEKHMANVLFHLGLFLALCKTMHSFH